MAFWNQGRSRFNGGTGDNEILSSRIASGELARRVEKAAGRFKLILQYAMQTLWGSRRFQQKIKGGTQ